MSGPPGFLLAGSLAELEKRGCIVVSGGPAPIAVFHAGGQPRAVDNRCPHLGFPLAQGTVKDGILVCHWHKARFDLTCGGTLDPWADDVAAHAVSVIDGEVWVAARPAARDPVEHATLGLEDGLAHDIRLVVAKSVLALDAAGAPARLPLAAAARFGARNRAEGWSAGMSILTMTANLLPSLRPEDLPRALYQGALHVAGDCAGRAPRFPRAALPTRELGAERLDRWFRELVEVRDRQGAERVLATAIAAPLPADAIAAMLFAAATDRVYLDGGHALDFVNKAFELLDHLGFEEHAGTMLPSLIGPLVSGERMEESAWWRSPIDLIELLHASHRRLPALLAGAPRRPEAWTGREELSAVLLGDDPRASLAALEAALGDGVPALALAETVAYAAALRIARFPTSNEFSDWDAALHTLTYANAVMQAVRRIGGRMELVRGVLDAAMSVYLDRFLNVPAVPIPEPPPGDAASAPRLLADLSALTDVQQQVDRAGALAAGFLAVGGDAGSLRRALGEMLLREDAHFHTFQAVEAGFALEERLRADVPASRRVLVAVARYLAAHAPTSRVRGQTYRTALRLARGESMHET